MLDELTFDQLFMYLDYGLEYEEMRAAILVAKLGQALNGKMEPLRKQQSDKPDKRAFRERYHGKIKRPGGE